MKKEHQIELGVILFVLSFWICPATAQNSDYKDRLARMRDIINSDELVMIWSQGTSPGAQRCYQRIYDLDLTQPGGIDSTLVRKPMAVDSSVSGADRMSVAAGNFLGGKVKDFVAAWSGPGNSVTVAVPEVDAGTLSWTTANHLSVSGLMPLGGNRKIHVETGDFYGDRQDEFVLAFEGSDTTVHLQVYAFDPGDLVPHLRGSINDEHMMSPGTNLDNWNLATGDFDGDGSDDIALLFVKPLGGSNWGLYAKIYTVDDQGNIVPKAFTEVFPKPGYAVTDVNLVGVKGAFDTDAAFELAFGFCFFQGEQPEPDTYVYLLDVRNSLNAVILSDSSRAELNTVSSNDMQPLDIAAGDLDGDDRDEVVLMSGATFYVYAVDDSFLPQFRSQRSVPTVGDNDISDNFLAVGDMDLDQRADIVVAKNFFDADPGGLQHFELMVFSPDSTLTSFTVKARRLSEEPVLTSSGVRHYAIALGDFDGDRTRLGPPAHYRRTGILQPTVLLYTPPVHYDIFDTTKVDLSGCYPGQGCGFSSSYIQSSSIDTTVTTETHEDWGADASVTIGFPVIKEKVKATYGEKFSNRESSTNSMVVSTGRIAAGDDWIYANVYDIDFYEYPVLDSLNNLLGHFLVSVPGTPRPLWVESKDDATLGNLFKADHEVGNVLSYPLQATADTAKVIVSFPEQTVGSTGTSFSSLSLSSFRENQVDSSWDAGVEVNVTIDALADFKIWEVGVEVELSGHYNSGEVVTQTVKVGSSLEVRGDLGHLQPQFGTSGTYYVRPYAYWNASGALALDYRVSALPGGAGSFWQSRYGGKSDLAFSLPWRFDLEKGFPLPGNDPAYRYRSRDIGLSKALPHGGDTVTIGARVRNLGLQAVQPPVTVRFYRGDPSAGGTLIAERTVDSAIAGRGTRNVYASWAIPLADSLGTDRIFAVIDPDNAVTGEVHEDNNTGWAPALAYGLVSGVGNSGDLPHRFTMYEAYPNPFNPMTTIMFDLPSAAHVLMTVHNVLGQVVVTLADEGRSAGSHRLHFNAAGLASGVYFCRLIARGEGTDRFQQVATRKLVVLK